MLFSTLAQLLLLTAAAGASSRESPSKKACSARTITTLPNPIALYARPASSPSAKSLPIVVSTVIDTKLGFYFPMNVARAGTAPSNFTFSGQALYGINTGGTVLSTAPGGGLLDLGLLTAKQVYQAADTTATTVPVQIVTSCTNGKESMFLRQVGLLGLSSNFVSNTSGPAAGDALFTVPTQPLDVDLLGREFLIEAIEMAASS